MFKFLLVAALVAVVLANENADVVKQSQDVRPDGFDHVVELSDGSHSSASGDIHGAAHGSFGWISKDGVHVELKYVADENGYQPQSDLLPVAPPIPDYILKSIEYINAHPDSESKKH